MQHLGNGGTVRELLAAALVTLSASERDSWGNNSWGDWGRDNWNAAGHSGGEWTDGQRWAQWYGNGGGEWKKGEKWQAVKQEEAEEVDDAEQEVEQGSQIPYSEFLVILPIGIPYIFLVEP